MAHAIEVTGVEQGDAAFEGRLGPLAAEALRRAGDEPGLAHGCPPKRCGGERERRYAALLGPFDGLTLEPAARLLTQLGYDVRNLDGGYLTWRDGTLARRAARADELATSGSPAA